MVQGQVLGDSPAALTPDEGRPPLPTETTDGDTRCPDLKEGVAGNRLTMRDRRSMDVGTRATGRLGYRRREQVTEASTATQDGVQAECPSRRETGTVSCTGEEASSMERAVATGKEERTTLTQNEMCIEGERAPAA